MAPTARPATLHDSHAPHHDPAARTRTLGTWRSARPLAVELPWVGAAGLLVTVATLSLATHLSGPMASPLASVAVDAALTALGGVGVLAIALGRPARLPRWIAGCAVAVGSGATATRSAYLLVPMIPGTPLGPSGSMTALDADAEAVRLIAGVTTALVALWLLSGRRSTPR